MYIRKATAGDLDALMPIFDEARKTIGALGIDQWQDGYPRRTDISADIECDRSYCLVLDDNIIGSFAVIDDGEPTYDKIYDGHWLTGDDSRDYIAIHRVAIAVASRGSGASAFMMQYAAELARGIGRKSVRIDTHEGNVVMRRMLEKNGFTYCGVIYLDSGAARVAYEKIV